MKDKFLTEAMGYVNVYVNDRGDIYAATIPDDVRHFIGKVGSWELFGMRWEWAQQQEWWPRFVIRCKLTFYIGLLGNVIHPDRFADALYAFLKERAE